MEALLKMLNMSQGGGVQEDAFMAVGTLVEGKWYTTLLIYLCSVSSRANANLNMDYVIQDIDGQWTLLSSTTKLDN